MSLYNGSKAVEAGEFRDYKPGPYKFKIKSAEHNEQYNSISIELETWGEDGEKGPKVLDYISLQHNSDAVMQETDRRLTTIMGNPSLEKAGDLVGKTGYVILRKVEKYLEATPFGGYFTADRKSATGNTDSILVRIKEAQEFNWENDPYCVKRVQKRNAARGAQNSAASTPETDADEPF